MLKIKDYMMKRGKVKVVSAILYTRNSKKVINFFNCLILYFFSGKNLQYGSQIKISPPKSVELIDKGEYLLSRDPYRNFPPYSIENEKALFKKQFFDCFK